MNTLNDAQTLFSLLFGIYFAVSIGLVGKFQPFDTPSMHIGNRHAWIRFIFSFLWLNILPIGYYVFVIDKLNKVTVFPFEFSPVLAILMLSLTGFGFYRIYFGIMLLKWGENFFFFGKELPKTVRDEWDLRPEPHKDWKAHVYPGLIWTLATTEWGFIWLLSYKP